MMTTKMTFALPYGYNWNVSEFKKKVLTKAWVKTHKRHLSSYASRMTSWGVDYSQVIKSMLQAAYGYNIGDQICAKLKPSDYEKIRGNLLDVIYDE